MVAGGQTLLQSDRRFGSRESSELEVAGCGRDCFVGKTSMQREMNKLRLRQPISNVCQKVL